MKKLLSVSAMALVLLAGCSSTTSYYGESAADEDGNVSTVSFDKSGDDISNVQFDIILPEVTGDTAQTTSKKELSNAGEYGMEAATGKSWTAHVEELEAYVNDNDAFPTLDEEGKDADGVTGATIHLNGFEEAFNAATEA
ncbi:FMN-binding protein [Mollicutes bacterium LVI A0078]|nr:FMN-binding protein [Mollicutes bacterium LVI A0075]WOO91691.1 FMN-binding protein [Mollicutes bacterium LVI A0078]